MNYKQFILPGLLLVLTLMVYFYQPLKKESVLPAGFPTAQTVSGNQYIPLTYDRIIEEDNKLTTELLIINSLKVQKDPFSGKINTVKPNQKPGTQVKTDNTNKINKKPGIPKKLNLRVDGIWISNNQRIAIIEGNTVKTNESINGYTITAIKEKQVHLIKNGNSYVLYLER